MDSEPNNFAYTSAYRVVDEIIMRSAATECYEIRPWTIFWTIVYWCDLASMYSIWISTEGRIGSERYSILTELCRKSEWKRPTHFAT